MKSREIQPIWMSAFGIVIAPMACAVNATVAGLVTGEINWLQAPLCFLAVWFFALVVCFPLGLLSEKILKWSQSGQMARARWLSAIGGLVCLACWKAFLPRVEWRLDTEDYFFVAPLLIPVLWSLLFLLFALFARPARK